MMMMMMMGCSSRARARAYVLFFSYVGESWKRNGKLFISLSLRKAAGGFDTRARATTSTTTRTRA